MPNPPFCIFYITFNFLCVHLFWSEDVCLWTVHMPDWVHPHGTTLFLLLCVSHSFIQSPEALEKNKQWLEYDQQREAYVRAIMARMLWLEKQLNEASQARSQQHNEDHSDGESEGQWVVGTHNWGNKGQKTVTTRFSRYRNCPGVAQYYRVCSMKCIVKIWCFITTWAVSNFFDYVRLCVNSSSSASLITEKEQLKRMQEHYERLLQKAKDELEVLREQVDVTQQNLIITQKWCVYC